MTTKEFNKKVKNIFEKYNITHTILLDDYRSDTVPTIFGNMSIRVGYVKEIKVASIYSNFMKASIEDYAETRRNIKKLTGYSFSSVLKNNYYFDDPTECLEFFEKYLVSMLYVEGKTNNN